MKKTIILLLVVLLMVPVTACNTSPGPSNGETQSGGTNGEPIDAEPATVEALAAKDVSGENYTFITNSPGGTFYTLASGYADLMMQGTGGTIRVDASSPGGAVSLQYINNGDAQIAMDNIGNWYESYTGTGYFKDVGAVKNLRALFVTSSYTTMTHIVTLESSNIRSLSDLNGKVIAAGAAGSPFEKYLLEICDVFDIDIRIENIVTADAVDKLKDNLIDGFMHSGGVPIPSISDLAATKDISILSFTDEEVEAICNNNPSHFPKIIPAGSYPGVDYDVNTFGGVFMIGCSTDVSDAFVYQLLEQIYNTSEADLKAIHNTAGPLDPEDILNSPIPIHNGAIVFYESIGIEIPDELKS